MARQCPHCDYDMSGLPSDICPECGKRYDPRLAAIRELQRLRQGFQIEDWLLVAAFLIASNLQGPLTAATVAASTGAWIWLRRDLLRRAPAGLWLALLAIACAGGASGWQAAPPGLEEVFNGLAIGLVILELVRFRLRTVATLARGLGICFTIFGAIGALVAAIYVIAGGSGAGWYFMGLEIEPDTRVGYALAALLNAAVTGLGWALWRAGGWLRRRSGARASP
ncbi:MAG: hypothetical protein ACF8R7_00555 [Phycisphaerales bacterium JB039]